MLCGRCDKYFDEAGLLLWEVSKVLLTRRKLMSSTLGTMSAGILRSGEARAALGLSSVAARRGLFFGSAVRAEQLWNEPDLMRAVLQDCAVITPEVGLKWAAIEPVRGQLTLAGMDALAQFASGHGKTMRGHTLLWHRSTPSWAEASLGDRRDWNLISKYFASVIPRYKEVIHQWDVVNEPIDTGHRMDGLRRNVFLDAFGPDYIRRALLEARNYAPGAKLMINEFSLEYDSPEERDRRYLLLKLIEGLKKSGTPLDGLGLQAHLDLRKGSISAPSINAFLKEVVGMGLDIVVTELDVKESDYTAPVNVRDRLVADEVRRYLDVVLDHRMVTGVVTWGLSDRQSWLKVMKEDYSRFSGAWDTGDGPGVNRGLPYDASMHRKAMYQAIETALRAA